MADYLVDTEFRAKDLTNPVLRNMEKGVQRFSKSAKSNLKDVFKGSFMGTMTANMTMQGLNLVRRGIQNVVSEYMNFDETINEAAVKFGGIDYGTKEFKEIGDVAREVGRTTKFTTADAASGLQAMAGAGIEAANAMKLLPTVANFAAAAKMDLATATQTAGQALNAFAMNSKDAETQARNLTMISDTLAKTDRKTMASMYGLAETVGWAAGMFTAAGQSVTTFGAIAGGLADVAIEGGAAGTVMRNMIQNLTQIGPKGKKALGKLGMSMKDIVSNKGKMANLVDILGKMEAPMKTMGSHKRTQVISDLFGMRAVRGVLPLLNAGISKVKDLEVELGNAAGESKRMGDQLNQSLTFRVMALQNALLEKGFQVFEAFLGNSKGGIEGMIDAVNKFNVKGIVSGFQAIGKVVTLIADNIGAITRLGIAFASVKAALVAQGAIAWGSQLSAALRGVSGAGGVAGGRASAIAAAGASEAGPGAGTGWFQGAGGRMTYGAGALTPAISDAVSGGMKAGLKNIGSLAINNPAHIAIAGALGWQVGDAIDTYLLEPMRKFSRDMETATENLFTRENKLLGGKMKEDELRKTREEAKKFAETGGAGLISTDTILGMFASLFGDAENPLAKNINERMRAGGMFQESGRQLENMYSQDKAAQEQQWKHEAPFREAQFVIDQKMDAAAYQQDAYIAQQEEINKTYALFAENMDKANKAAENFLSGSDTKIKVEISDEGTVKKVKTKTKSTGPRAPKVDVSQSGKN